MKIIIIERVRRNASQQPSQCHMPYAVAGMPAGLGVRIQDSALTALMHMNAAETFIHSSFSYSP